MPAPMGFAPVQGFTTDASQLARADYRSSGMGMTPEELVAGEAHARMQPHALAGMGCPPCSSSGGSKLGLAIVVGMAIGAAAGWHAAQYYKKAR